MTPLEPNAVELPASTRAFYRHALVVLPEANVPFMVCGSYALAAYTKLGRPTRDLDILVRQEDCSAALAALAAAGYSTDIVFPHWLAKVFCGEDCLDVIFNSGNGICKVDDTWFVHALDGDVLGVPVRLCPPEEAIWQQSFIMERERFDGADVAHLIRAQADSLDWQRLLGRFGAHWRVLLAHLVLFGFVYPDQRSLVPAEVMHELLKRLQDDAANNPDGCLVCQGTLLSRAQYLVDIDHWGYRDARLAPPGTMTRQDVEIWTAPIQAEAMKMQK